jgi:hypothetical protein
VNLKLVGEFKEKQQALAFVLALYKTIPSDIKDDFNENFLLLRECLGELRSTSSSE